jgi:hypothetical protein
MKKLALFLSFLFVISCNKDPIIYTLTTSTNPAEGGTVSPSTQQFEEGETATITANPAAEYLFQSWSGVTGSTNSTSVVMNSDKSVTANFVKKLYPLTIEIEGEGIVEEKVIKAGLATDYNSGTIVELTAVPADGWEFVEWSGDITSIDNPSQITINGSKTVKARFKNSLFELKIQTININYPQAYDLKKLRNGFTREGVAGTFTLNIINNPFLWISGQSSLYEDTNPNSSDDVDPNPSVLFKKNNGNWELKRIYENVKTWNIRNYKVKNDHIVIGDGNEIGEGENWRGDAFIGEISGEEIDWTKINQENNKKFFHGITFGDLNGDNIVDVAGFPGYHFFMGGGSDYNYIEGYLNNDNKIIKHPVDQFNDKLYGDPFTAEFEDLDGDGIVEIITAHYADNPSFQTDEWRLRNLNNLTVYKKNSNSNKYEFFWGSENPYLLYPEISGTNAFGATSLKVNDFNNDGINDIAVAREYGQNNYEFDLAFDVWIGKNDGSYEQTFIKFFKSQEELEWREFDVIDVNKDGFLDIILNSNGGKTFYVNNKNTDEGVSLNSSIWINNGAGIFNSYSLKELKISEFKGSLIKPYLSNGDFFIIGTSTDMTINNYSGNVLPVTFYDLKINL